MPWAVFTSSNVVPGHNGGFLGRACDPFRLVIPDDQRPEFAPPLTELPPGVGGPRHARRRGLLEELQRHDRLGHDRSAREMTELYGRAFHLIESRTTADAFRLDREPPGVRDRYGRN